MSSIVDSVNENAHDIKCCLFFSHLRKSRFNEESLRSQSESDFLKSSEILDPKEQWNNRSEFLLSCIGFAVGLGNVWRFPFVVYENGGGAFLISYTIFCLAFGVPLLMLELGLGQFSGRGTTKVFKLVPIMYGIGWSMVVVSTLIETYYSAVIAICFFYLFGSLSNVMPWTVCTHTFNSEQCLGSTEDKSYNNRSTVYISSTAEYWDYYVTGFVKYPSRTIYTMNENPGPPQWHLSLCLLLTWILAGFALMNGIKISGKIMYFSVLYPFFALFSIFCISTTLPGAINGLRFYLTPNWNKVYDPHALCMALEQICFSCGIAVGGMITYASYNNFRDNFYRDAIIIILADYIISVLAGFAVFPILGYMAERNGVRIEKVINSGSGLFFITFTEALATIPGSRFWTFLLMLMAIALGMDSQFALFETVSTGIIDQFPILHTKKLYKTLVVWILCLGFFSCGLLFITPGGKYWFDIFDRRVSSLGLPFLTILETVCVGIFYGYKQLRYDYRMMTGFSLSWYWFFMIAFVIPVIITIILVLNLFSIDHIYVNEKPIPMWGEIVAFFLLFLLVFPILYGIVYTIVTYYRKYPELKGLKFLKKLFNSPVYWGPLHKKYWTTAKIYRNKLFENKDNPLFYKYTTDAEDINLIVAMTQVEPSF